MTKERHLLFGILRWLIREHGACSQEIRKLRRCKTLRAAIIMAYDNDFIEWVEDQLFGTCQGWCAYKQLSPSRISRIRHAVLQAYNSR